jgi:hypothetical protein
MSYKSLASLPHANISARIATETHITKRVGKNKSSEKKRKDSMQPSDELASLFGVCPKPTFSRIKE